MVSKTKAQIFTFDFIVGFVGFILIVVLALTYLIQQQPGISYEEAYRSNIHIASVLLEPGFPVDWNNGTVIIPGIAQNNRLNVTKLNRFSEISYEQSKALFHSPAEYLFYFQNASGIINITQCTYGVPVTTNSTCEPQLDVLFYENLIRTDRLVVYNTSIIEMVVYSWN